MSAAQYKATVMFVLFSAEEVQRQGSINFAKWIHDDGVDVIGMINLDTIGTFTISTATARIGTCASFPPGPTTHPRRAGWRGKPIFSAIITASISTCA